MRGQGQGEGVGSRLGNGEIRGVEGLKRRIPLGPEDEGGLREGERDAEGQWTGRQGGGLDTGRAYQEMGLWGCRQLWGDLAL